MPYKLIKEFDTQTNEVTKVTFVNISIAKDGSLLSRSEDLPPEVFASDTTETIKASLEGITELMAEADKNKSFSNNTITQWNHIARNLLQIINVTERTDAKRPIPLGSAPRLGEE